MPRKWLAALANYAARGGPISGDAPRRVERVRDIPYSFYSSPPAVAPRRHQEGKEPVGQRAQRRITRRAPLLPPVQAVLADGGGRGDIPAPRLDVDTGREPVRAARDLRPSGGEVEMVSAARRVCGDGADPFVAAIEEQAAEGCVAAVARIDIDDDDPARAARDPDAGRRVAERGPPCGDLLHVRRRFGRPRLDERLAQATKRENLESLSGEGDCSGEDRRRLDGGMQ